MMMSGKDFLKSHVLSWRKKVYSDWEDVTSSGRSFQVFESQQLGKYIISLTLSCKKIC